MYLKVYQSVDQLINALGAKAFSIKSRVTNSDGENSGLANNFGNIQIYSIVKIFKEN